MADSDHQTEQELLGCLLIDPDQLDDPRVARLHPEDFAIPPHQVLFECVRVLREDGDPVDVLSVCRALEAGGSDALARIGGREAMATIATSVPTGAGAGLAAEAVARASARRAAEAGARELVTLARRGDLAGVSARAAQLAGQVSTARARSHRLPLEDIDVRPAPRPALLVEERDGDSRPVLHRGLVGILAAAGGTGKSWLLYQLAVIVAVSDHIPAPPWCGFRLAEGAAGRVLLLMGEADALEVRERLHHVVQCLFPPEDRARAFDLVRERLHAWPLAGVNATLAEADARSGALQTTDLRDAVRAELRAHEDWALVGVDPLSCFGPADLEKDNAAASKFVHGVLAGLVHDAGGATLLAAAHVAKALRSDARAGVNAVRGAGGQTDAARWQATLTARKRYEQAPELVDMSFGKANHAPRAPDRVLRRRPGGLLTRASKHDIDAWETAGTRPAEDPPAARNGASRPRPPGDLEDL
jgi:hypothetical protein